MPPVRGPAPHHGAVDRADVPTDPPLPAPAATPAGDTSLRAETRPNSHDIRRPATGAPTGHLGAPLCPPCQVHIPTVCTGCYALFLVPIGTMTVMHPAPNSNRYHGDERVTEELSQRLLQLTPSLYSADDAKRAKAEECLSLASDLSGDPSLKVPISVP